MKACRACLSLRGFSCWKNGRAKNYRRRNSGRSIDRGATVQQRFSFSPRSAINDSLHLQPALADWSFVVSAALSRQDVSARRLPREIRTTLRNLRSSPLCAPLLEETDLVACGQRWRGNDCTEAIWTNSLFEARPTFRADHHHDHRIRFRKQERARL